MIDLKAYNQKLLQEFENIKKSKRTSVHILLIRSRNLDVQQKSSFEIWDSDNDYDFDYIDTNADKQK